MPRDEHHRRHRPPPDSVHSCFQLEEAAGRKEVPHPNVQNQGSTWCGVDRPTSWWWLKANLGTLTLKNAEAAKSWRPHSPGGVTQIDALNQSPASGNINPDDTGGSTPELRPLHTGMARAM